MTRTAKRTERRRFRKGNGLESLVDFAAFAVLPFGAFVAFGLLFTFSFLGVVASCVILIGSMLTWLLLRCFGEHLRLLKKIAGCEFEGYITGPHEETIWACGHCGLVLHSDSRCESCGAEILPNDA